MYCFCPPTWQQWHHMKMLYILNFEYHFKMFGHKTGVNILRNIGHWTPASQSSDLVITRMIIQTKSDYTQYQYTGETTKWSPMSVCNHTSDYKIAGVGFVNHEYDYRPTSDDTKSTYQLDYNFRDVQEIKILLV